MSEKPFVWRSRVRFGDTDASGRIFYASLFHHMGAAETEFLRHRGVSYGGQTEIGFPRVHVECDFASSLVFDDPMDIAVTVERVGRSSFTLAFDVSVDGRHAARGKLVIVSIDLATQRAVALPENLRAALTA